MIAFHYVQTPMEDLKLKPFKEIHLIFFTDFHNKIFLFRKADNQPISNQNKTNVIPDYYHNMINYSSYISLYFHFNTLRVLKP